MSPFGGAGLRNNKENVNINACVKKSITKSEKKMFIKNNTYITIAFLKKICRMKGTKLFAEFYAIIEKVEQDMNNGEGKINIRIKEEIKDIIK